MIERQAKTTAAPIHQQYCGPISDHNYSVNPNDNLQYTNWVYHGEAFKAFASSVPGTVPIYEAYNSSLYMHHYSTNQYEKDYLPLALP